MTRLVPGSVALLGIEALLFASYQGHDARFHWFVHFFVGASAACLAMAFTSLRTGRAPPWPALWVVLGHLTAMVPDLLFAAGSAHQRWMDLFLGHLVVHSLPGRDIGWLAIFLVSFAAYLVAADHAGPPHAASQSPQARRV